MLSNLGNISCKNAIKMDLMWFDLIWYDLKQHGQDQWKKKGLKQQIKPDSEPAKHLLEDELDPPFSPF